MENNEEKRGPGRPRLETTMPTEWEKIIIQAGREGKHITHFLIQLGISWDSHYELIKRNVKYSETIKEYNKLCEEWWYAKAHEAIEGGQSNKFNQRLWTIIMKNKFRDNWKDEKQMDITTQGDKINDAKVINIEIIKPDTEE